MLSRSATCVPRSIDASRSGTPSTCSELKRVFAQSVFCLFLLLFFTPAKSVSRDMGQGREESYRQGWNLILKVQSFALNLSCPSAGSQWDPDQALLSSWCGGQLGNQVPQAFITKDPDSSNWVSTQPLRKVLTVLSSTHPQDPQVALTMDRRSYLFLRNQSTLASLASHDTYGMCPLSGGKGLGQVSFEEQLELGGTAWSQEAGSWGLICTTTSYEPRVGCCILLGPL